MFWQDTDESAIIMLSKDNLPKVGDVVFSTMARTLTREPWIGTVTEVNDKVVYVFWKNYYKTPVEHPLPFAVRGMISDPDEIALFTLAGY